jgi:hypothetical protein
MYPLEVTIQFSKLYTYFRDRSVIQNTPFLILIRNYSEFKNKGRMCSMRPLFLGSSDYFA